MPNKSNIEKYIVWDDEISPEVKDIIWDDKPTAGEQILSQALGGGESGKVSGAGREIPPEPSFMKRMLEEAIEPENVAGTVGGIAGGMVGAPLGPLGVAGGAMGGAGLMGALSKALAPIDEKMTKWVGGLFDKNERPRTTDIPDTLESEQDYKEILSDIGMAGLEQAAYEGFGFGLTAGVTKGFVNPIIKAFMGKVTPEGKTAIKTLMPYTTKRGIYPVLPAEATQGWFSDFATNVAEVGVFGGGQIADVYRPARKEAMDEMLDVIRDGIGRHMAPDDIGEAFVKAIDGKYDARSILMAPLYKQIDGLMAMNTVWTSEVKNVLRPFEKAIAASGKEAPPIVRSFINNTLSKSDRMTWMGARQWKENLGYRLRELQKAGANKKQLMLVKRVMAKLQRQMRKTTELVGGPAPQAWRNVNEGYAKLSRDLNKKFIHKLVDSARLYDKPEGIVKAIFQKDARQKIRIVKKTLGSDSLQWQAMQRWYLEKLITNSTEGSELMGKAFYNNLIGKQSIGDETLREIFNETTINNLRDFAITIKLIQEKQASGMGRMFIQLKQPAAVMQVGAAMVTGMSGATYGSPMMIAASGAILGMPAVFSRMFTDKKVARLLIEGVKIPRKSPHYVAAVTRILDAANDAWKEEKKERSSLIGKARQTNIGLTSEEVKEKRKEGTVYAQ